MRWPLLVLTLLSKTVLAQDSYNYFKYPGPPGPTNDFSLNSKVKVGDVLPLSWATNYTLLSLALWQNNNGSFEYLPGMKDVTITTFYQWTVSLMNFDLKRGNVFFLDVFAEDNTGRQLTSHYFNISAGDVQSSSSASISSTGGPTSITSIPTATPTRTTAVPSPQASGSSSGLSTGAKAGIGIGVSLVVIGAAALALILLLRRSRRRRHQNKEVVSTQENWYPMAAPDMNSGGYRGGHDEGVKEAPGGHREFYRQEMPVESDPQELPAEKH